MKNPNFTDLDSYLRINPISRRISWENDIQYASKMALDQHLLEAQILLEEYAIIQSERLLMSEGAKYLEKKDFLGNSSKILLTLDTEHAKIFNECMLEPIKQRMKPIKKLNGIPKEGEILNASDHLSICQLTENRKLLQEVLSEIRDEQSEEWIRLDYVSRYLNESIVNVGLLKKIR